MGIKGLNNLIKECFQEVHKHDFKHHRIAIDFLIFWNVFWISSAREVIFETPLPLLLEQKVPIDPILQRTFERFRQFIHELVGYQIMPVIIFEGSSYELKKQYAGVRREEQRKKQKERYDAIQINENSSQKEIEEWKALLSYTTRFPFKESVEGVQEMLSYCGIPYLTCKTEAEHLCASLCKEGYVTAVYTTDTDVLALKTPLMIVRAGSSDGKEYNPDVFQIVQHHKVVQHLQLTHESFVDLCILCETDYNERIPGIGEKKALKFIQEHNNIEAFDQNILGPMRDQRFQKYQKDPSDKRKKEWEKTKKETLEYDFCRQVFNSSPSSELSKVSVDNMLLNKLNRNDNPFKIYKPGFIENLETIRSYIDEIPPIPIRRYPDSKHDIKHEYEIVKGE